MTKLWPCPPALHSRVQFLDGRYCNFEWFSWYEDWFLVTVFRSCDKAQNQKLRLDGTSNIVSLGHFYAYINVTQVNFKEQLDFPEIQQYLKEFSFQKSFQLKTASWICTLGWLALVISGIVRFALNRQLRTQGATMSSDTANISTIEPTAWTWWTSTNGLV